MYEFWTELKIHPKKIQKNFRKISKKNFFFAFFLVKILKWRENSQIWGLKQSRNSGDHEFWNHEMRGSPVVLTAVLLPIPKNSNEYRYLKCTAILILILNVKKYWGSISIPSRSSIFQYQYPYLIYKTHFITFFIKQELKI